MGKRVYKTSVEKREAAREYYLAHADDRKAYARQYNLNNQEKKRAAGRDWYQKNKAKILSRRLERLYGLAEGDVQRMLDEQSGLCAVCQRAFDTTPHVDHDHMTGKVRGLLHRVCNVLLGHAEDSPDLLEKAAAYLRSKGK